MARKRGHRAVTHVDPQALAEFRAGIRKRYTDEQILDQLRACAEAIGRSPTMQDFSRHEGSTVHPQTVIERFGSWNAAKRAAGLVPRRFATKEELLQCLRVLGDRLGRVPTSKDIDEHRGLVPSKSLYWHTFGSLTNALREAGFDVPVGEERLDRLPKFADWREARREDSSLLTEWQVYRMFDARRGAWATFQYLVRERLLEAGVAVAADGGVRG